MDQGGRIERLLTDPSSTLRFCHHAQFVVNPTEQPLPGRFVAVRPLANQSGHRFARVGVEVVHTRGLAFVVQANRCQRRLPLRVEVIARCDDRTRQERRPGYLKKLVVCHADRKGCDARHAEAPRGRSGVTRDASTFNTSTRCRTTRGLAAAVSPPSDGACAGPSRSTPTGRTQPAQNCPALVHSPARGRGRCDTRSGQPQDCSGIRSPHRSCAR